MPSSRTLTRRSAITGAFALGLAAGIAPTATAGAAPGAATDAAGFRLTEVGSTPGYDWLTQMVATRRTNAWAFGETASLWGSFGPIARRWNGRSWFDVALPAGLDRGISLARASGPRDVWAFGGGDEGGQAYALRWDGHRWSVVRQWPEDELVTDAAVLGPRDVWVFGTSHIGPGIGTWHFDGLAWTRFETPPVFISQASAVSPDDIWAIGISENGDADDLLTRWNGTAWTPVEIPGIPRQADHHLRFGGIYAASSHNVWIIGGEILSDGEGSTETPFALHFNGHAWRRIDPPGTGIDTVSRISPDGRGGIWVVPTSTGEYSHTPWLLHYAHRRWARVPLQLPDGRLARVHQVTAVPHSRTTWAAGEVFPGDRSTTDAAIWRHGPARA